MLSLLSCLEEGEDDDDEDARSTKQGLWISPTFGNVTQALKLAVTMVLFKQAFKLAVFMGEVKFKLVLPISYFHASSKHSILELLLSFSFKEGYGHVFPLVSKGGQTPLLIFSVVNESSKAHLSLLGEIMGTICLDDDAILMGFGLLGDDFMINEAGDAYNEDDDGAARFILLTFQHDEAFSIGEKHGEKNISKALDVLLFFLFWFFDKHSLMGGYVEGNVSLLFSVFKLRSRDFLALSPLEVSAKNIGKNSSVLELVDGSLKFLFDAPTFGVIFSPSKVKDGEGRTPLEVPYVMAIIQSISCTSLDKDNQLKQDFVNDLYGVDEEGDLVLKFVDVHRSFYVHGHGEKVEPSHGEDESKERDLVLRQTSSSKGFSHAVFMDALEVAGEDKGSDDAHTAKGGSQPTMDVLAPDGMKNTSKAKGHCRPHTSYGHQDIGPMDNTQRTWSLSAHISRHVPQNLGCRQDSPKKYPKQRISRLSDTPIDKPRPRTHELTCLRHVAPDEVKHGSFCHASFLLKEGAFSDMLLQHDVPCSLQRSKFFSRGPSQRPTVRHCSLLFCNDPCMVLFIAMLLFQSQLVKGFMYLGSVLYERSSAKSDCTLAYLANVNRTQLVRMLV